MQSLTTTFNLNIKPETDLNLGIKGFKEEAMFVGFHFSLFQQMEILSQLLNTFLPLIREKFSENVCILAGPCKSAHKISNMIFYFIFLWVVHWFILNKLILSFPMRICILVQFHCSRIRPVLHSQMEFNKITSVFTFRL